LCQERLGGGAFVMHRTDEKCVQNFGGDPKDRNTLKDYAYTGDNINCKRQEIEWQAVGRINLVLVENKWHSLVNTLTKI